MFEKSLKEKLGRIFGFDKVSYDFPDDDSKEQEGMFIKVDKAISSVTHGWAKVRAIGSFTVFANSQKMPFGFFNKRIHQANTEDTIDLFFYNIDQNEKYFGNLVGRTCSFVYFYKTQYDPNAGHITSLSLTLDDEA